jgi:putative membrane protein
VHIKIKALAAIGVAIAGAGIANAMPTMDYIKMAGASDLFERDSARVVLMTTTNPEVKKFATMMVMDHSKSTDMVKSAARASSITPKEPRLMAKQQAMLAELKAAQGPARDTLYISQQKAAHQEALATQQDYATTGPNALLKRTAAQIVPVVQQHISMLNAMPM